MNLQVTGIIVVVECNDGVTRQVALRPDQRQSVLNYCQHRLLGGRLRLTDLNAHMLEDATPTQDAVETADEASPQGTKVNRKLLETAFAAMYNLIIQHHDVSLPAPKLGEECQACMQSNARRAAMQQPSVFELMAMAMGELGLSTRAHNS